MKIGVVADTHSRDVPKKLWDAFKEVDLVVHAGDFCDEAVLKKFRKVKEVKAVYGNMDEPGLRRLLPRKQIFKAGKFKVGLFHGEGAPQQLLECLKREFKGDQVDLVIFGHSHQPFNEKVGDTLYFNPGSPNDDVFAPYHSYGIVDIAEDTITAEVIKI